MKKSLTGSTFRTSNLLRDTLGDAEDEQSIAFSIDQDMFKKLDIKKPRKGEDYSTYEHNKIYDYQLARDTAKIVQARGSYQQRNSKFLQIRQSDPDYLEIAQPKSLGEKADFIELLQYTSRISWQATSQPYGAIAHKRHLEYLANLPKGPTEEELKDREQRKQDKELWTEVITGRTEPTKKQIKMMKLEIQKQEMREKGLVVEDDEFDAPIVLTREEERRLNLRNNDFEKLRSLPTRREFQHSMQAWHKGIHYPYNLDKGFPYVACIVKDHHMSDAKQEVSKQYSSKRLLKGLHGNAKRYSAYLGQMNYEKASAYLESHRNKLERAQHRAVVASSEQERTRRRVAQQGLDIAQPLARAKLAMAKDALAFTVHVAEDDGHDIHAHAHGKADPGELGMGDDAFSSSSGSSRSRGQQGGSECTGMAQASDSSGDHRRLHFMDASLDRPQSYQQSIQGLAQYFSNTFSRSARYKASSVLPHPHPSSSELSIPRVSVSRPFAESSVARTAHRAFRSVRHFYGYLFDGVVYKTPMQHRKEQMLHRLQSLLDEIYTDNFADQLLHLTPTEQPTDIYIDEMMRKRRYFYMQIASIQKQKQTSNASMRQLEMLKKRLELFEEANRKRLDKQEQAEREIEMMKDALLEKELEVQAWQESYGQRFIAWIIHKIAKKAKGRKHAEGKKLAHLLPIIQVGGYAEEVEGLLAKRIKERKAEHRQRSRFAKLAGLDYSNSLANKAADDLVVAAESGNYREVLDYLDKRESIDDPFDPLVPINALNSDGVTALFATLILIMHKEILDDDEDYEELGMTSLQKFMKRFRWQQKPSHEANIDLVLQILIHYGGNLNFHRAMLAEDGMAVLHYAAAEGSVELMEWLLLQDVSVNLLTRDQRRTSLMIAVENDQMEAVMLLLRFGAMTGIHLLDSAGNNALHYGAKHASVTMVRVLLLCGANTTVRNQAGQLPSELARAMNRYDISSLIASYKGDMHDEKTRIDFLYDTTMPYQFEQQDEERVEEPAPVTAHNEMATVAEVAVAPPQRRVSMEVSAKGSTEASLAIQAMKKRSASYKVNKMWRNQLNESDKLIGKPAAVAGSTLTMPSLSRKESVKAMPQTQTHKVKRKLIQKSFMQINTSNT